MDVFCIVPKDDKQILKCSREEFENLMGITYLPTLEFQKKSIEQSIIKRCTKPKIRTHLSRRQKWLSAFNEKEILTGKIIDGLVVKWIDPLLEYGVFTTNDIPAHTFIGEYTGEVVRKRLFRKHNDYCFSYSAGGFLKTPFIIDAEKKGSLVRFINHSDQPNLEPIPIFVGGTMHIVLYSLHPIPKGTQLGYDYGEDYWAKRDDPRSLVDADEFHFEDES